MWILLLAVVGLVAGVALVLGLERRYARPILVFALLGLVVGALIGSVRVVPAGHVGIIDFFGRVNPNSLKSGINFVNPLARVVPMSIRTQEDKETMSVLGVLTGRTSDVVEKAKLEVALGIIQSGSLFRDPIEKHSQTFRDAILIMQRVMSRIKTWHPREKRRPHIIYTGRVDSNRRRH